MNEKLIRTPSIDEALAYLEAFLFGETPMQLWIIGGRGVGKSFLANWARAQTKNGKRGAIFDGHVPDETLPFWVTFQRELPNDPNIDVIHINPPEYERKRGVLSEWAAARHLQWGKNALDTILNVPTDNLQLLRSLAQRTVLEGGLLSRTIGEIDVVRTLARIGYLEPSAKQASATQHAPPKGTKIH